MDIEIKARNIESAEDTLKTLAPQELASDVLATLINGFNEINAQKSGVRETNRQKKRTIEEIDELISKVQESIVNRERIMMEEYQTAQGWYDEYETRKAQAQKDYEAQISSIHLLSGTKESLQLLIEQKQREINHLEDMISNGEYKETVDPEIEEKLGRAYAQFAKKLKALEGNWKVYADNKINKTILGIYPEGVKKPRRGIKEMLDDDKEYLAELMEERDAIIAEGNKTPEQMRKELMSNTKTANELDALFGDLD